MATESMECHFFFNDTATAEIYTLSLHDALPICAVDSSVPSQAAHSAGVGPAQAVAWLRSEEHTSELQSRRDLVCRLLLEKKKMNMTIPAAIDATTIAANIIMFLRVCGSISTVHS